MIDYIIYVKIIIGVCVCVLPDDWQYLFFDRKKYTTRLIKIYTYIKDMFKVINKISHI